ncbi:hypothetical protein CEXT_293621 [Caerostris extrusa]|uniref:Uncharacterized protein n=1 Tax=Caerostris extrusa TaxID=172846 RepID=A0AAV4MSE9_CAEEX|nr:hypothetical protein CEXT_293621 [Caerostris extrusa]
MGLPPNGKDIERWCGWIGISHCYLEKEYHLEISDHKAQHFRSCAEGFCLFVPILQLIGRQPYLKLFFCAHLSGLENEDWLRGVICPVP